MNKALIAAALIAIGTGCKTTSPKEYISEYNKKTGETTTFSYGTSPTKQAKFVNKSLDFILEENVLTDKVEATIPNLTYHAVVGDDADSHGTYIGGNISVYFTEFSTFSYYDVMGILFHEISHHHWYTLDKKEQKIFIDEVKKIRKDFKELGNTYTEEWAKKGYTTRQFSSIKSLISMENVYTRGYKEVRDEYNRKHLFNSLRSVKDDVEEIFYGTEAYAYFAGFEAIHQSKEYISCTIPDSLRLFYFSFFRELPVNPTPAQSPELYENGHLVQ